MPEPESHVSSKNVRKLVRKWQILRRLKDWHIKVRVMKELIDAENDMICHGMICWEPDTRNAELRISSHWDTNRTPRELEETIIHELGHLKHEGHADTKPYCKDEEVAHNDDAALLYELFYKEPGKATKPRSKAKANAVALPEATADVSAVQQSS